MLNPVILTGHPLRSHFAHRVPLRFAKGDVYILLRIAPRHSERARLCHSERSEESPPFVERKGARGMASPPFVERKGARGMLDFAAT